MSSYTVILKIGGFATNNEINNFLEHGKWIWMDALQEMMYVWAKNQVEKSLAIRENAN